MIPKGWRVVTPDDDSTVRVVGRVCAECKGRGEYPESWVDCVVCEGTGTA